jgi:serine O-acetyltransferase
MNPSLRRTRLCISSLRLLPHIIVFIFCKDHDLFLYDFKRWTEIYFSEFPATKLKRIYFFIYFMTFMREFRNLFYFRYGMKSRCLSWLCKPLHSLEIQRNIAIGPGLFIQHGASTLIAARRIGANCWINQQVTTGYSNKTDLPTIGDNVTIGPGAKIIGNVLIGDNVTVGPNTVVIDSVPPNVTVLGVPARIVSRKPALTCEVPGKS